MKTSEVWQGWGVCWIHQNGIVPKLSSYLGFACHFSLHARDPTFRQMDIEYFLGEQRVGFADGTFPFLLLNVVTGGG